MSIVKSGPSLRNLVLTPERIPNFFIPSRSPLLSPRPHQSSPDRTILLSDHDDSPPGYPRRPTASRRMLLSLPRIRRLRHVSAAPDADADTDLTTRAAMSLPHVEKVTTPYGFRAVLAASPCTRRRESLFHRNKPVTVTVTDSDLKDQAAPSPPPGPVGSRVCLRPVKALGLQVMKELKALSPATRTR